MNRIIYIAPHTSQCHTVAPSSTRPGNTPTPATLADVPVGEIDGRAHGRPWPQMHNWIYVLRPSSAHCTDWVAPGPWMTSAANKVRHRSCERFHALRRWDDGIRVEGRAHVIAPSRQTTDQYPIPWVHCTNTHDEHALLLLRLNVRICANGPPGVCPSHG